MVDSLDSGSSVHCGRAGSSPASPTKKETPLWVSLFYMCRVNGLEPMRYNLPVAGCLPTAGPRQHNYFHESENENQGLPCPPKRKDTHLRVFFFYDAQSRDLNCCRHWEIMYLHCTIENVILALQAMPDIIFRSTAV